MDESKGKGHINPRPAISYDLIKTNGLLQSLVLEMRYHCEVYKLSLRSINKILKQLRLEHVKGNPLETSNNLIRHSARSNYEKSIVILSQKKALEKIDVVLRKAKVFINGYSLLETPVANRCETQSSSQIAIQDPKEQQQPTISPPLLQMRDPCGSRTSAMSERKKEMQKKVDSSNSKPELDKVLNCPKPLSDDSSSVSKEKWVQCFDCSIPLSNTDTLSKDALEMNLKQVPSKICKRSDSTSSSSSGMLSTSSKSQSSDKDSAAGSKSMTSTDKQKPRTRSREKYIKNKSLGSLKPKSNHKYGERDPIKKRKEKLKSHHARVHHSVSKRKAGHQFRKKLDHVTSRSISNSSTRAIDKTYKKYVAHVDGNGDDDEDEGKSEGKQERKIDTIVNSHRMVHSNQNSVMRKYTRFYNNFNYNNYGKKNDNQGYRSRQYYHNYHCQQIETHERRYGENCSSSNKPHQRKYLGNDSRTRYWGTGCNNTFFDDNEFQEKVRRVDVYPENNNNKGKSELDLGSEHYFHRESAASGLIGLQKSTESQVSDSSAGVERIENVTKNTSNLREECQVQIPRVTTTLAQQKLEVRYLEDPRLKKRQIQQAKALKPQKLITVMGEGNEGEKDNGVV